MEITFQNKLEDFDAYYDYVLRETDRGKAYSARLYRSTQLRSVLFSALFGSLWWAVNGFWFNGLGMFIFWLVLLEAILFLRSGFNPRYYEAKQSYKRQEKFVNPKELQAYLLPRLLKADSDWLEISNSETMHRWRWRRVDHIHLTTDFVFIQASSSSVLYVPKRDFPSEKSFIEFGKELIEWKEKSKDQSIGTA